MFENRNLNLDLFALSLLAVVVFVALSLCTYDPADSVGELISPFDRLYQPDSLVYPPRDELVNACGRWGALAADILFTGLGLGAYYLVFSLAALDVTLLRRQDIDAAIVRTLGWMLSLIGFTVVAAMLAPGLAPGPVIGSGGYLGALASGWLQAHFAAGGSFILAVSLILGGLLLSTDYALMQIAGRVVGGAWKGFLAGRRRRATRKSAGREAADADPENAEPEALAVRIRGKRVTDGLEAEGAEDEQLDEDEPWEDEEEGEYEDEYEDEEEAEEPEGGEAQQTAQEAGGAEPGGGRPAAAAQGLAAQGPRIRKPSDRSEREQVMRELETASRSDNPGDYELPDLSLLTEGDDVCFDAQAKEVRRKAKILEKTFADFGFKVKVVEVETGPVIAQYEVELEAGLRLSRITGLADDLAIALRVPSVRIVAPIPGKNTVGIEVPNDVRQLVRLREVIEESNGRAKKMQIPLFLGKDVSGNPLAVDLTTLPHLLIAGRTGTGKSVCLNAIITSILMTRRPDEVRMLLIDPKMVELSGYGCLAHLMHPVVTDMRKAEAILAWAVEKMEERYALLAKAGVRHVSSYNQLGEEELMERLKPEDEEQRQSIPIHLPFIVIVADELADLMLTAGKEVEQHIIRLAQKSRAVGIHLILATQKPTVDVITGLIKSNLPARISFQVASRTDSRVVLDEMGADKLLGNGDMLFLWPGTSTLLRGQGTYLSDDEINAVVDAVSTGEQNFVNELVDMQVDEPGETEPGRLKKRDELYESAVDVVVREGRGSVSLLQRTLGIGYGRAARLIDYMAEDNIVGAYAGSQAREVLITLEDWERMQGSTEEPQLAPAPPKPRRSNKILFNVAGSGQQTAEANARTACAPGEKHGGTRTVESARRLDEHDEERHRHCGAEFYRDGNRQLFAGEQEDAEEWLAEYEEESEFQEEDDCDEDCQDEYDEDEQEDDGYEEDDEEDDEDEECEDEDSEYEEDEYEEEGCEEDEYEEGGREARYEAESA